MYFKTPQQCRWSRERATATCKPNWILGRVEEYTHIMTRDTMLDFGHLNFVMELKCLFWGAFTPDSSPLPWCKLKVIVKVISFYFFSLSGSIHIYLFSLVGLR